MRCRQRAVLDHSEPDILHVGCVGEYTWIDRLNHDVWIHGALVDRFGHDAVVGIDVYEPGVEALRSEGYDVRLADAEDFDLGRRFRTVVAPQMLHHLSNPGLAVRRFAEHTAPGGRVVLAHPNHYYIERQLAYMLEARRGVSRQGRHEKPEGHTDHTASHRPSNLVELFEREGLELVEGYYLPGDAEYETVAGLLWHRGARPALDRFLPDLLTKKMYVAVFEPRAPPRRRRSGAASEGA